MPSVDLLQRLKGPRSAEGSGGPAAPTRPWQDDALRQVTARIQASLRQDSPSLLNPTDISGEAQAELLSRIHGYLTSDPALALPGVQVDVLARQVFDYVAGLGPVGALLERPEVSEIMVNRHDDVWIEAEGKLRRLPGIAFRDDTHVFYVAQRVLAPLGIELSAARPLAEGRLPGNIRVAASMPPAGPNTTLSVRRKSHNLVLSPSEALCTGHREE